ncbi:MAG: GNAT family N-acetyltransferase [Opitutae bacterium]|nr:GNAT family N-acetyltransferase [Opitutae bacterium]
MSSRDWMLRPLTSADGDAVLRLNAENRPAVATIEAGDLPWLLAGEGHHLVAVNSSGHVIGYLLSFPRDSTYDDTEMAELRRLLAEPFYYICQVALAREQRGRGIGRAFYAAVAQVARERGARFLCCDVNLDPPNPESHAFHERLGFRRIATGVASNGFKIAYLACEV